MPRYVILHHIVEQTSSITNRGSHYDWMFDDGTILWTWATTQAPWDRGSNGSVNANAAANGEALRLPGHRRFYLTYEGNVSNNRGRVERIEEGEFVWLRQSDDVVEFSLLKPRVGKLIFQRTRSADNVEDDFWKWAFFPTRAEAS